MTQSRFTQAVIESVDSPTPPSRFTQAAVEAIVSPIPVSRFTQASVEVLVANTPRSRFTQAAVETLIPNAAPLSLSVSGQLWPRGGDTPPGMGGAVVDATKIRGVDVSSTPPTSGQALVYNGTLYVPAGVGKVVQVVNTQTGALATGTTIIPFDDTIPQSTEGDQYMSLSITPKNAANTLLIQVVAFVTSNQANWITLALFKDSDTGALAAFTNYQNIATGGNASQFNHYMTAGTTSPITFKLRIGRDASAGGTVSLNGAGGVRVFGGVMSSSITITEFAA